jgi:hypothetical protein
VRLLHINSLCSETVDDHQIVREHIRALVIFGGDVLRDRIGQRHRMGASERELQDIAVVAKSGNKLIKVDLKYGFATGDKLTMPLFRGGVI